MYVFRLLVSALLLFVCSSAQATSLILSDQPESIQAEDPFAITASFSGSKSGCGSKTYYLKGVFYQDSGGLFGRTENGQGEWIDESEVPSRFFSFTTSEDGSWSGKIKLKGTIDTSGFKGQGMYQLRVDRYTQTGTSKAESSNSVPITLLYTPPPTPTPTPTPSVSPRPTATPTPSASSGPTATPTPTPTATPLSVTFSPHPSPALTRQSEATLAGFPTILGDSTATTAVATASPPSSSPSIIVPIIITLGGICIAGGGLSLGTSILGKGLD